MDPLSQAVVGGLASQSISKKTSYLIATLLGCLSGMAPDLDVLIRSQSDPLLAFEFHRQFTHSLFFIPIGALICAVFFHVVFARKHISFKLNYWFCFAGYATHGLLDSCTTYGTQLFWPFINYRVSWNNISIIDPLFTVPIVVLLLIAAVIKSKKLTRFTVFYCVLYLFFGLLQNYRVVNIAQQLALSRGHEVKLISAKPSFANLLLWKSIYEYQGKFYIDAIRILVGSRIYQGSAVNKLDVDRDMPWLQKESQQYRDLKRFEWFSQGYLSLNHGNEQQVVDMRYSLLPHQASGLWGIEFDKDKQSQHVKRFRQNRDLTGLQPLFKTLFCMIAMKPHCLLEQDSKNLISQVN